MRPEMDLLREQSTAASVFGAAVVRLTPVSGDQGRWAIGVSPPIESVR